MIDGFRLDLAKLCPVPSDTPSAARNCQLIHAKREAPNFLTISAMVRQTALRSNWRNGDDSAEYQGRIRTDAAQLWQRNRPASIPLCCLGPRGPRRRRIWAAPLVTGAFNKSAGFAAEGRLPTLTVSRKTLCAQAMPHYQKLYDQRLRWSNG